MRQNAEVCLYVACPSLDSRQTVVTKVDFGNLSGIPGRVATVVGVLFEGIFCIAPSHRLCRKPQSWMNVVLLG